MKRNAPMRALVLDDDQAVRDGLSRAIESSGWKCVSAPVAAGERARGSADGGVGAGFVSLSAAGWGEAARAARKSLPGAAVVAIADLDGRSELDEALDSGLVEDFISLPFASGEIAGIMRLLESEA